MLISVVCMWFGYFERLFYIHAHDMSNLLIYKLDRRVLILLDVVQNELKIESLNLI